MGWVPFQLLYLGPFSNVRCKQGNQHRIASLVNTSVNRKKHPDFVHELLFDNFMIIHRSAILFTIEHNLKLG